ncbi:hypothetical protein TNCV_3612931 [Trichonephila clavipes]|uniref:Uncharacterized protein n=1 Tax=Trichonephila clavipes TaxID=2585209 RepID=A0A8X6VIK4_TRICX|nr:hypothetical protein TNCV_3612931 [Trichonephila clavipes]
MDQNSRKGSARLILGRGIRFSNQFSKISVTLPDNIGRLYFRHTLAGTYLKRPLAYFEMGNANLISVRRNCRNFAGRPSITLTGAEAYPKSFGARKVVCGILRDDEYKIGF